ncbi:hypothetical protein, partial [Escherichia coli]|uniref:hypothetical protein n=1 Tax=Escherichia coli TaxID=562 RepID=UPI003F27D41B
LSNLFAWTIPFLVASADVARACWTAQSVVNYLLFLNDPTPFRQNVSYVALAFSTLVLGAETLSPGFGCSWRFAWCAQVCSLYLVDTFRAVA